MKAVLTNFGTTGDFRPLLTLARELADRGDVPVLAFPPFAEELARQSGFAYRSVGPDLRSLRDEVNQTWSETASIYDAPEQMASLLLPFRDAFDQTLAELMQMTNGSDALISGPAQPLARIVYELTGVPFISLQVSHFGGSGGPGLNGAAEQLVNPFRRKLGLRPVAEPFTTGANSPQLALYAMSPRLRARPPDWPAHYHVTGFFFDEPPPTWRPDPETCEFFAAGSAPVVISLGSMIHSESGRLVKTLLRAIELTGCRAVIQGMATVDREADPSQQVYWAEFIPHAWLFPRAACVVLHGGSGTAAAAFRSGVPTVFIPHGDCYDQRYWAQISEEAGCSPPAIQYAELTAEALAEALSRAMSDVCLRRAASALGKDVAREPGVAYAARLIRTFVRQVGLCSE